jgi:hypothetical protein
MQRNKYILFLIFSCLLLLIGILTVTGCGESVSASKEDYIIFNFKADDIRFKLKGTLIHDHPLFTFEYPSTFTKTNNEDEILSNMRATLVSFEREPKGSDDSLPKTSLSVSVHEPGLWSDTDAKTTINNIIAYHNSDSDFFIIERSTRNINGLKAEFLSYSYHQSARERFGDIPIPAYNGVVKFSCFDYQDLIWRIYLSCLEEEAPETEIYFQHILDTLQILE